MYSSTYLEISLKNIKILHRFIEQHGPIFKLKETMLIIKSDLLHVLGEEYFLNKKHILSNLKQIQLFVSQWY